MAGGSNKGERKPSKGQQRRAARLAAVQGLYELALSGRRVDDLVHDFSGRGGTALLEAEQGSEADEDLYVDLLRGVARRKDDIQAIVSDAVGEGGRAFSQLDLLMQAILMAATYELIARSDIDPPLTINEYVEVTHAFFAGREPSLVNGVLDRIAHDLRSEDLDQTGGSATRKTS